MANLKSSTFVCEVKKGVAIMRKALIFKIINDQKEIITIALPFKKDIFNQDFSSTSAQFFLSLNEKLHFFDKAMLVTLYEAIKEENGKILSIEKALIFDDMKLMADRIIHHA